MSDGMMKTRSPSKTHANLGSHSIIQGRYHYIKLFSHRLDEQWFIKLHDTKRHEWTNHDAVFSTAEEAQAQAVRLAISHVLQNGDKPTQDPSRVVWVRE
jgi:hypothetical protein